MLVLLRLDGVPGQVATQCLRRYYPEPMSDANETNPQRPFLTRNNDMLPDLV
jgi:hypothetical protein